MGAFARRMAWHVHVAWRTSRVTAAAALLGGLVLPTLLPVTQAWLVAAVAASAALLAVVLVAIDGDPPTGSSEPEAALERAGTRALLAHAVLRAALILGALAAGLAIGGLLPSAR